MSFNRVTSDLEERKLKQTFAKGFIEIFYSLSNPSEGILSLLLIRMCSSFILRNTKRHMISAIWKN